MECAAAGYKVGRQLQPGDSSQQQPGASSQGPAARGQQPGASSQGQAARGKQPGASSQLPSRVVHLLCWAADQVALAGAQPAAPAPPIAAGAAPARPPASPPPHPPAHPPLGTLCVASVWFYIRYLNPLHYDSVAIKQGKAVEVCTR